MASMPELGSKISLISKSDIRYEGQLYTVDPNECTIALANVRSYGTEDREGQFAIPPQEEIFDYILFRGSDIKDIRVVNNVPRVPHDPAIMQMHVSAPNQPNFQPQFSMPVMPHVGGQVGPFGGNNQPGPFGNLTAPNAQGNQLPQGASGLSFGQQQPSQPQQQPNNQQPAPSQQQQQNAQQPQQKNSVLDLIGGSRSTTPVSLNSRKSPTAEMGVQVNQKDGGNRRNNNRGPQDGRRMDSQGSHENRNQQRNNQYQQQGNNQNRGGWVRNNNQNQRNNQRPQRRPGLHPQSFRQNLNTQNNKNGRPKTTIKFESDFDFEQANTKFEEMRLSLAKLKVGEEAKPEQVQVNGEAEKKDDSGNETGAGEQEQEEDDVTVGYDKAKSFFDNISCEAATDRKGKNRTDWRLERKLNSETFGVSSARRGGFYNYNRSRPGNNANNYYNNRNSGMNYRNNGYNNGFRGNNFRNQRNNFNQRNQNQGNNQQENPTTSLPQEKQQPTQQSQSAGTPAPAVAAGGNK